MKFKKVYDESGNEVPTFKQLGISPEIENREMEKGDEHFNQWYDSKIKAWQLSRRMKSQSISAKKAESEKLSSLNHWYNSLSAEKKNELILRAVSKRDDIFEVFLKSINIKSPLYMYYFSLLDRIKPENIKLPIVNYSKLKRFPKYNASDDKLDGSPISYITMFISCFPPNSKSKNAIKV